MKSVEPHDEDEPTDNKQVELFISPGLFKRGDADGEKFDAFSIIEPSSVMWIEAKGVPSHPSAAVRTVESREQTTERRESVQHHLQSNSKEPQHPQHTQQHLQSESQAEDDGHDSEGSPEGSDPMEVEQTHQNEPKHETVKDSSAKKDAPPKQKKNVVKGLVTKMSGSQGDRRHH
jgi:hypothetical protein